MPLLTLARKIIAPAPSADDADGVQYGAIPYKIVDGQVVFLMVTSRRSANWVFPKGSVISGLSPQEVAAREAFEEAGVRGELGDKPVGGYLHPRNKDENSLMQVKLFAMKVTEQLDDWPEEAQRFRHWATLPQVRQLMASKQAVRAAADLSRSLLRKKSAAGQ